MFIVLLLSYKQLNIFSIFYILGTHQALFNPGPNLLINDQVHFIKNMKTILSQALNGVANRRRLVLTRCPMQNNLPEYWLVLSKI